MDEEVFVFGSFRLISAQRTLFEAGKALRLGSRAFDILVALVERPGETISKEELIARAWPGTVVEEAALRVHVAALRKALGDGRAGKRYIANLSGRGYAFTAPVTRENALSATAAPTGMAEAGNLPALLTRVVGRDGVISRLAQQLVRRRFLTIVGPGGIGKTTVAVAVADVVRASYGDGAWYLGLGSLSDPDLLPGALCALMGITLSGVNPLSGLAAGLRDKHFLIVLDSCEHVIGAAAALAEALLKAAPHAGIVATSREPLRAEGEWLHRLAPLELPPQERTFPTAAEALGYSAVELFNERATATIDRFVLDDADVPAVLEICRRLDGVPLALELAAARAAALGLRGVCARLDDRFALLIGGRRTALPHQQTLRAMLDWSYELLPEPERRLLRHLAVFVGGISVKAAIAVMEGAGHPTSPVMEGLSNLVDKSLVMHDPSESAGRWRLLDTIRAYALEKLVESGEAGDAARCHAEVFRDLFGFAEDGSQLQPSAEAMARFAREIDNIRAALDWAFSPSGDPAIGVILTAHCAPAWVHSAMLPECAERTLCALRHLQPDMQLSDALRMRLHLALGLSFGMTMGPVERGKAALTHALELAEKLQDRDAQLRALWALWALHFNIGETRVAQAIVERFASAAGRADDPAALLIAERLRGYVLHHLGEHRAAQQCFERVLELYPPRPDRGYALLRELDQRVLARGMLARVLWLQGYLDQAEEQARSTLEDAEALGYQPSICEALRLAVCPLAMMDGDLALATRAVAKLGDIANGANCAPFYSVLARCLGAKLSIIQGGFASAVASLHAEFGASERTAWAIWHPEFMGALAEGLAGLGRLGEALAVIDQALAKADAGGECYYVPELLRIKGELLLRCEGKPPAGVAEQCFEQALVTARGQNALFWELQAALSLGRLRLQQRKPDRARQILAAVYDRFTEGLDRTDLRAARGLLDLLSSGHRDEPAAAQ